MHDEDSLAPVDYLVVEFPAEAANFFGEMAAELSVPFSVISLVTRFGRERALAAPLDCIEHVVREVLEQR